MTPSPIDSSVMRACSLPRPSDVSRLLRCVMSRATVMSAGSPPNVRPSAMQLRPHPLVVVADELDLERRQRLAAFGGGPDVLAHPGTVRGTQQVGDRLADQRLRARRRTARPPRDSRRGSSAHESARPRAACRPTRRTARRARPPADLRSARQRVPPRRSRSSNRFIDAVMSTKALSRPLTGIRSACRPTPTGCADPREAARPP